MEHTEFIILLMFSEDLKKNIYNIFLYPLHVFIITLNDSLQTSK